MAVTGSPPSARPQRDMIASRRAAGINVVVSLAVATALLIVVNVIGHLVSADHNLRWNVETLGRYGLSGTAKRVLDQVTPDVCHVHELAGLPLSVFGVLRDLGVPTVMTLQDYFPLCPAFKLLDASGAICLRREVGADCLATMAADERPPGLLIEATVAFHLQRLPGLRFLGESRRWRWVSRNSSACSSGGN